MNKWDKCQECSFEYNVNNVGSCPICGCDPYIFTNGELEGEGEG